MALTVQNLRAVGTGVEPASLLPAQIAFNITDKVLYVGDGSNFKTKFDGTQVPAGVPGEGWYSMPMDFSSLGDYYVANPGYYGDVPTDQQVLTWSTSLNHPIWTSGGGGGGGNQVYVVTNAQVASAPGTTLSDKITAAIGVASPDEGDVTIVTGLPDDVYEGLYFFTTEWVKGASYAYPSATEVIYDNTTHPTLTPTVQGAISDLDDGLIATTAIANTANSTANSALSIANAALPRSGGTMTGTIVSRNIDVPSPYSIQFDSGNAGTLNGISDSISSVSSTVAASSSSVRAAYQLAQAALPYAGGTMTGTITFASGQIFPVSGIQDATTSQKGVVRVGTNIDVASGVISVKTASAGQLGLVQVGSNIDVNGLGVISVRAASASQLGLVQVGSNIEVNGLGVISINPATNSSLGVVQTGTHILNTAGVISVTEASTTTKGVVQLNDTATSTSTLQALTANQGRLLQNQINNLTIAGGVTLAGGFDPNIPAMESVTTAGSGVGFNVGSNLPLPATVSNYYVIVVADDSSYSPPGGGGPYSLVNGDWLLSDGVAWNYLGVGQRPASASYTQAGIVQLADCTATLAGTSDILAITPQSLCDITTSAVNNTCSRCLASALAVKTVNDTATAALPKAGGTMTGNITFQDAGEGIIFNGGSQLFAISDSTSTTSSTTAASSTALKAAYDFAGAAIPCSLVSSLGDIITADGTGTPVALPLGTNGQVLIVNTACATGLEWVTDTPGDVTSVTGTAPIQIDNTDPQNPVVSIDAASLVSCGAVQLSDSLNSSSDSVAATAGALCTTYFLADLANNTANAAIPCASFLAKGNLLGGTSAGNFSALSVGTNGQVLIADSACSTGLKWGDACYVPDACFTAAGQIIVGTGAGAYVALPVGTDCQTLVVNSACTATGGVTWGVSLTGYTCSVANGNTALGVGAGDSITTGLHNTVIGSCAGSAISAGDNNTFVGWCTGDGLTSGNNNTVVGALAFGNTGGSNNTIMGYCSGAALTTGNSNTLIGSNAGDAIAGGNSIVGVGQGVLGGVVTAAGTVAIGATAGAALTSGANTTLVGFAAGDSITTGARNTVVGHTSGGAITTGADNTIIGALAGNLTTGTGSTILGSCAGAALTLGGSNVFLGAGAGDLVTTGFNNTIVGDVGGSTSLTGNLILAAGTTIKFQANNSGAWSPDGTNFGTIGQVLTSQGTVAAPAWCTLSLACVPCSAFTAVGDILVGTGSSTFSALPLGANGQALVVDTACASGVKWVTASGLNLAGFTCSATPFNTALGSLAGAAFTVNSVANTAIGYAALDSETSGDFNVAIGHNALTAQNGATGNTAVGANAGAAITSGSSNTIIGHSAGTGITSGGNNTFVGTCAGDLLTNGNFNTALGSAALGSQTAGDNNTALGQSAGTSVTTGQDNTFVGQSAGSNVTTGSGITAVGYLAGRSAATGTTAVGCRSLQIATGANNTAVGWNTGACLTTGACNTAVGYGALDTSTTGNDNTAVGNFALTAVTTGSTNTAVGSIAAQSLTTGVDNVAVGYGAMVNSTGGNCNVAIGRSTLSVVAGNSNTAVGHRAGLNVSSGGVTAVGSNALTSVTTGTANTAVGFSAGCSYSGSRSVFIGHGAGDVATTGNSHVFIGADAGGSVTLGIRNILIGDTAGDAITTGSNNTIIGDIAGSAALADNLILAAGNTIKLQVNENGAVGVGSTPSYGTAGQVLKSAGTGAAPAWSSAQYGAFSSTAIQTNADTVNGNAVSLNTVASSNGFSIVSNTQVTAAAEGVYNIQISLQFEKTDAGTDTVEVWFKKNGANIANSNTSLQLEGNGAKQVFSLNWVEPMTAGQNIEVWWYSADANVQMASIAAGTRPAIPSAIVTIVPVGS